MRKQSQKGMALLLVLLIVSLMIAVATGMTSRLTNIYVGTESQIQQQQAYWYSIAMEELAKSVLEQSFILDSSVVHLNQIWAMEDVSYPVGEAILEGTIIDKQTCFNVNVFQDGNAQQIEKYTEYLKQILIAAEVENFQSELISQSVREYIDRDDQIQTTQGYESRDYLSFQPSYMAPNASLAEISELRAVNGLTSDAFLAIKDLLCALPNSQWLVNINTLKPEQAAVLFGLFEGKIALSNLAEYLDDRPIDGWKSVDEFMENSLFQSLDKTIADSAKQAIVVDSNYFELDAQVQLGTILVRVKSLLFSNDKQSFKVIRRRFGGIRGQ